MSKSIYDALASNIEFFLKELKCTNVKVSYDKVTGDMQAIYAVPRYIKNRLC